LSIKRCFPSSKRGTAIGRGKRIEDGLDVSSDLLRIQKGEIPSHCLGQTIFSLSGKPRRKAGGDGESGLKANVLLTAAKLKGAFEFTSTL
jgi:hypothetical protein